MALVPSPSPRWEAAAQRLVSALAAQSDNPSRSRLLERIATRFGQGHYLSFVQLLCAVDQFGDASARALVADAIAGAVASGRMPSGSVPAWGAPRPGPAIAPDRFGGVPGGGGRQLGPIEFVCAALLQPGISPAAGSADAEFALRRLLALLNASPRAAGLYAARLQSSADDPMEGTLSLRTRATLGALAAYWRAGDPPDRVVRRALAAALAAGH